MLQFISILCSWTECEVGGWRKEEREGSDGWRSERVTCPPLEPWPALTPETLKPAVKHQQGRIRSCVFKSYVYSLQYLLVNTVVWDLCPFYCNWGMLSQRVTCLMNISPLVNNTRKDVFLACKMCLNAKLTLKNINLNIVTTSPGVLWERAGSAHVSVWGWWRRESLVPRARQTRCRCSVAAGASAHHHHHLHSVCSSELLHVCASESRCLRRNDTEEQRRIWKTRSTMTRALTVLLCVFTLIRSKWKNSFVLYLRCNTSVTEVKRACLRFRNVWFIAVVKLWDNEIFPRSCKWMFGCSFCSKTL